MLCSPPNSWKQPNTLGKQGNTELNASLTSWHVKTLAEGWREVIVHRILQECCSFNLFIYFLIPRNERPKDTCGLENSLPTSLSKHFSKSPAQASENIVSSTELSKILTALSSGWHYVLPACDIPTANAIQVSPANDCIPPLPPHPYPNNLSGLLF